MTLTDVFSYHSSLTSETTYAKPWRLGAWLWATQGRMAVALADDGSEADATPERYLKGEHYLTAMPSDLHPVSLSALRAFAGSAPSKDAMCDCCLGTGRSNFGEPLIVCEHCGEETRTECEYCGGDGKAGLELRNGKVLNLRFNLTLLAFALAQVPQHEVASMGTLQSIKGGDPALAIVGTSWRIVLMAMLDYGDVSMPSFRNERSGQPEAVAAVVPGSGDSNP